MREKRRMRRRDGDGAEIVIAWMALGIWSQMQKVQIARQYANNKTLIRLSRAGCAWVSCCTRQGTKGPLFFFFTLTSTMQRSAAPADGFFPSVLLLDSLGAVSLSGGSQESTSEARIAFGSSTALSVVEVKPQNDY